MRLCRRSAVAAGVLQTLTMVAVFGSSYHPFFVLGVDRAPAADDPIVLVPEVPGPRHLRFPSIEDRVKVYMSNWYVPPCSNYSQGHVRFEYQQRNSSATSFPRLRLQRAGGNHNSTLPIVEIESLIEPDKIFYVDPETLLDCSVPKDDDAIDDGQKHKSSRIQARKNMVMYCQDAADSLLRAINHVNWETKSAYEDFPMLVQFGDLDHSHVYGFFDAPHFRKFRSAASKEDLSLATSPECIDRPRQVLNTAEGSVNFQPIIWKLATQRHFGMLDDLYRDDVPWSSKLDAAVFRGQLTGSRHGFDKHKSSEENCLNLVRCRLVYNHENSTRVHARLTSMRNRLPDTINGVNLVAKKVPISYMLRYKGIIMLEGNDVASGLKWALLSNSVVLMPPCRRTSWMMEELLEPWVHYVPLQDNADDIEEKMQWILDNEEAAQRIAYRGSLWMQDLVFHPDAALDERLIQEEMVRRYQRHFSPSA